ncbi:MAG: HAMP domain-containing histidine kinase [Actinomycetota bacterium]|nr:HAMP domain-containing histidine kinase [Actinomycetota bacterium]
MTFIILAGFAGIVGALTTRQIRRQFNSDVNFTADRIRADLDRSKLVLRNGKLTGCNNRRDLSAIAGSEPGSLIRIFSGADLKCTPSLTHAKGDEPGPASSLFSTAPNQTSGSFAHAGYQLAVRQFTPGPKAPQNGTLTMLYGRPLSAVNHTQARVELFLLLGALGGTVLALLAGLATAQTAMRPIRELTEAAREIERTRDPSRRVPHPRADDEIAVLALTLEGMLGALDSARNDTETMLHRQREFVADASHELRTPLTSVLANLELLAEELDGEQAETAQAALRSTKRMRRLVGDLLLLARADAKRVQPERPTDLAEVLTEAVSELGPMAAEHQVSLDARPALVPGVRDDLHRLTLNLIENGLRHTPPGTQIRASTRTHDGYAVLTVEDDGPGIPAAIRQRVFERFVRSGHGSGLGLAIVRAVAESHGGTVSLERPASGRGARLVIRLPRDRARAADGAATNGGPQTSTTTGSTIGRRRSRS